MTIGEEGEGEEGNISQEVTLSRKSHLPGSDNLLSDSFPGKSHFPQSHISGKSHFREVTFPGSHISWEVTLSRKSHLPGSDIYLIAFPGSHISREVTFPGKSHLPDSFPGKSHFPGSYISGKSHFPGSHISGKSHFREVTFPGKSHFPGSHIYREVTITSKPSCQNLTIGEEGEGGGGKKRLVDLRRSSLMASPQVKRGRDRHYSSIE